MKRFLQLLCLLAVAALLPAALLAARGLPVDSHPYVEKKYAGWNGVLRAWVCAEWSCPGGFVRWLNACAAEFEKQHDGVYIEFTPVSAGALRGIGESGIRPPELVLFSPGTLDDASFLRAVAAPDGLRSELRGIGGGAAYPVAMGGYVWAYNRELASGAPGIGDSFAAPADDGARSFSAATVALLCDPLGEGPSEEGAPELGIDLGLPAASDSVAEAVEPLLADNALKRFISGDVPAVAVTQAELARLIRLRDAGRGPDWVCAAAGPAAYTDQLLLLGLVAQSGDGAQERMELAEAFGAGLLSADNQARLADVGAFSVTGERIYPDFSAYAELDVQLNGRELLAPSDVWSPPPGCEAILRELASGAVDPAASLALLRETLCKFSS